MSHAVAGRRIDADHHPAAHVMRSAKQCAVAADADDEIGSGQLSLERGADRDERAFGENYLAGFERASHRFYRALLRAVGVEQTFGRLVAFAGESGRAPSLRHRRLLDDDQTVVYLHKKIPITEPAAGNRLRALRPPRSSPHKPHSKAFARRRRMSPGIRPSSHPRL